MRPVLRYENRVRCSGPLFAPTAMAKWGKSVGQLMA